MDKINIAEKFSRFAKHWTPKIIGETNGQYVKLAKARGTMVWHSHHDEDELFIVFEGALTIEFRDGKVVLESGEMFIVPRGVEHRTLADQETHFMMIEPKSTAHTGTVDSEQTVATEDQEWI